MEKGWRPRCKGFLTGAPVSEKGSRASFCVATVSSWRAAGLTVTGACLGAMTSTSRLATGSCAQQSRKNPCERPCSTTPSLDPAPEDTDATMATHAPCGKRQGAKACGEGSMSLAQRMSVAR